MKTKNVLFVLAATLLVSAGSLMAKQPEIDTSDSTRMTVDGLYPVKHTRFDVAFAKPDFDLSPYDKVLVAPVSIYYKRDSFELTEKQVAKMEKYFFAALNDQLTEKGYEVVNTPGQDVLLVEASIADLYVNRPTEPSIGRTKIFTASSGEMTLIGELRDSLSGEILVRFADRQQPRSHWAQSTSVSEWSEVRRAFKFWTGILHDRLEAFHESNE